MLGREGPTRALRDALASARKGRGALVTITGEAGIGKSALAAAFAEEAEAAGVPVTWGRAWEFADAPPYFPVWPCLRALGLDVPGRDPSRHDDGHAFQLWEAVLGSLASASASAPLVWIVEDVHAADLGTLDLLTFLAQPLRATRAVVVITTRHHDPRLSERKLQRVARMMRDGLEIPLEPLGEREIAVVAEQTIGRALSAEAVRRLVELTGGNPLFVVECARASSRAGGVEGAFLALPPTVRQVIADRVSLLPDAARDALASGAVLGREFAAASVARMHDSDPVHVIDTLLPALRAGILRETRQGHLAFSHALVRDAIYDTTAEAERVRLHRRADLALAALGDAADVLVERARHAICAAPSGDPEVVLAAARRAADLLEREGAFDRAFALHARVDEARAAGFLPPASSSERLHVARIAREAGRADAARRLCEDVISSSRASGDAEALARAALLHAADVRMSVIDPRQVSLLEEALRSLGDRAPALSCRVLARLSTALQPADDPAEPTEMAREAVRRARALGDDATILDVLHLAGLGAYYAPAAERIAWAEELRDRALAADDVNKALTAWMWLAYWHADTGDFAAFERAAANALELSDVAGHPRLRWGPVMLAAGRALAVGRFEDADRHLTEVSQIAGNIDDPALALSIVTHEVMRARLLRRPDEVRSALARLDGVIDGVKRKEEFAAMFRASCMARLEDHEATRAELGRLDMTSAIREADAMPLMLLGEAIALAGADDQRRRVRAALAGLDAHEVHGAGMAFTYEGTVGRVIGLLDAALGDLPAAEAALRRALSLARARGQAPWVAQCAHELANVLHRLGADPEARALADEHAALSLELGMAGVAGPEALDGAAPRAPAAERDEALPFRMVKHGGVWTVERGERVARVKDSRGMQLLARLAERPEEEIHVLTLASNQGASAPESSAGEMLDDRARAAYRKRLLEIGEQLEAAEATGNTAAVGRLERERQALGAELGRALGLGGRARQAGSATERARVNVQRRLKVAVAQVTEVDEALGRFLDRSIRTGTYCCFRP